MENSLLILIIVLLLFLIIRNERKTSGCQCNYMQRFPAVDNRYRSGKGGRHQEYDQWQNPLPRNDYRYYSTYGFDFDVVDE